LRDVKADLLQKTNDLINLLTKGFEEDIIMNYNSVIDRYNSILLLIDRPLITPEDIVEMDKIKANVGLELTSVQRDIDEAFKNINYLLNINHIFSDKMLEKMTEALDRHNKHRNDFSKYKIIKLVSKNNTRNKKTQSKINSEKIEKKSKKIYSTLYQR
jgi:hypothetical protein